MYVAMAIFLSILVPIAAGIFYAIRKKRDRFYFYDAEFEAFIFVLVGLIVAWGWPIVIPLAAVVGIIWGVIILTAKITERIMDNRKVKK